MSTAMLQTSST